MPTSRNNLKNQKFTETLKKKYNSIVTEFPNNKTKQELFSIEKLTADITTLIATKSNLFQYNYGDVSVINALAELYTHSSTAPKEDAQYFTPSIVVEFMWALAYKHGFKSTGTILEPSAGTGKFINYAPIDKTVYKYDEKAKYLSEKISRNLTNKDIYSSKNVDFIELNPFSAILTKLQHPDINWLQNRETNRGLLSPLLSDVLANPKNYYKRQSLLLNYLGFSQVEAKLPLSKKYDLIIGNPPYGAGSSYKYNSLEGEFYDISLKRLANDGIIAFVTPTRLSTRKDIKSVIESNNEKLNETRGNLYEYNIVEDIILPYEVFSNNIDNVKNHRRAEIETSIVIIKKQLKNLTTGKSQENTQVKLFEESISLKSQYGTIESNSIASNLISDSEARGELIDKIKNYKNIDNKLFELVANNKSDREVLQSALTYKPENRQYLSEEDRGSLTDMTTQKLQSLIIKDIYTNTEEKDIFNSNLVDINKKEIKNIKPAVDVVESINQLNKKIKKTINTTKQVVLPTKITTGLILSTQKIETIPLDDLNLSLNQKEYKSILESIQSKDNPDILIYNKDDTQELFNEGYLAFIDGIYTPSVYYYSGRIYDKLDQLEIDYNQKLINKIAYNRQKTGLQNVIPYYAKIDTNNRQEKIYLNYAKSRSLFEELTFQPEKDSFVGDYKGLTPITFQTAIDLILNNVASSIVSGYKVLEDSQIKTLLQIKNDIVNNEEQGRVFSSFVDKLKEKKSTLSKLESFNLQDILKDGNVKAKRGEAYNKDTNPNGITPGERTSVSRLLQDFSSFILDSAFIKFIPSEKLKEVELTINQNMTDVPVRFDKLPIIGQFSKYYGKDRNNKDILFSFRRPQRIAITFANTMKNAILSLDVGLGKTISSIAIADMQMSLGKIKRPLIITPKGVTPQFIKEVLKMLPHRNVLILGSLSKPDKEKLNKQGLIDKNGQLNIDKIPENTILIGTHELVNSFIFNDKLLTDIIDTIAYIFPEKKSKDDSKLSTKGSNLIQYINEKQTGAESLDIDKLGIDLMITDEAHLLSNVFTSLEIAKDSEVDDNQKQEKSTLEKIKGLDGSRVSSKAIKWFIASQILHSKEGMNILLTATPLENKIQELYALLMAANPQSMRDSGYFALEDFIKQFAEVGTENESVSTNGRVSVKDTLIVKQFKNKPELNYLLGKIMLYINGDEGGIMRPLKNIQTPVLKIPILHKAVQQYSYISQKTDLDTTSIESQVASFISEYKSSKNMKSLATQGFDMSLYNNGMITPLLSLASILSKDTSLASKLPQQYEQVILEMSSLFGSSEDEDTQEIDNKKTNYSSSLIEAVYDTSPHLQLLVDLIINKFKKFKQGEYTEITDDGIPGILVYNEQQKLAPLVKKVILKYAVDEKGKALLAENDIVFFDGKTSEKDRLEAKERFFSSIKDDNNQVIKSRANIIIGSAAAQVGLDLQKNADTVYIMTLPWNYTDLVQIIGRVNRFGSQYRQTNIIIPVLEGSAIPHRLEILAQKEQRNSSLFDMKKNSKVYESESNIDDMTDLEIIKYATLSKSDLIASKSREYITKYNKDISSDEETIIKIKNQVEGYKKILKGYEDFINTLPVFAKIHSKTKLVMADEPSTIETINEYISYTVNLIDYLRSHSSFIPSIPIDKLQNRYALSAYDIGASVKKGFSQLKIDNPELYKSKIKNIQDLFIELPNINVLKADGNTQKVDKSKIKQSNILDGKLSQWFEKLSKTYNFENQTPDAILKSLKSILGISGFSNTFVEKTKTGNDNSSSLLAIINKESTLLYPQNIQEYETSQLELIKSYEKSIEEKKQITTYLDVNKPNATEEIPDRVRELFTMIEANIDKIKSKSSLSYPTIAEISNSIISQIQSQEAISINNTIYNFIDIFQSYSIKTFATPLSETKEWFEKEKEKYYKNISYKEINSALAIDNMLSKFLSFSKTVTTTDLDFVNRTTVLVRLENAIKDDIVKSLLESNIQKVISNYDIKKAIEQAYLNNDVNDSQNQTKNIDNLTPQNYNNAALAFLPITAMTNTLGTAFDFVAQNVLSGLSLSKLLGVFLGSAESINRRDINIPNQEAIEGQNIKIIEASIIGEAIIAPYKEASNQILNDALKQEKQGIKSTLLRKFRIKKYSNFFEQIGELLMFTGSDENNQALPKDKLGSTYNKDFNAITGIYDFNPVKYNSNQLTALQLSFNNLLYDKNGYAKILMTDGELVIAKLKSGQVGTVKFDINPNSKANIDELKAKFNEALKLVDGKNADNVKASLQALNEASSIQLITTATPRDGDYKGIKLKEYVQTKFGSNKYSDIQIEAARKLRTLLNNLGTDLSKQGGIIGLNNTFAPIGFEATRALNKLNDESSTLNAFGGYNQSTTEQRFNKNMVIPNLNIATNLVDMFNRNSKRLSTSNLISQLELAGIIKTSQEVEKQSKRYLDLQQAFQSLKIGKPNTSVGLLTSSQNKPLIGQVENIQKKLDNIQLELEELNKLYGFNIAKENIYGATSKDTTFNSFFDIQGQVYFIPANVHNNFYLANVLPTPVENPTFITNKTDMFTKFGDTILSFSKIASKSGLADKMRESPIFYIIDRAAKLIQSGQTMSLKNQNENIAQSFIGSITGHTILATQIVTSFDIPKLVNLYKPNFSKKYANITNAISLAYNLDEFGTLSDLANETGNETYPLGNKITNATINKVVNNNVPQIFRLPLLFVKQLDKSFGHNLITTAMYSHLLDMSIEQKLSLEEMNNLPIQELAKIIAVAKNRTGSTLIAQGTNKNQSVLLREIANIPVLGGALYKFKNWVAQQVNNHNTQVNNIIEALGLRNTTRVDRLSGIQKSKVDVKRLKDALVAMIFLIVGDIALHKILSLLFNFFSDQSKNILGTASGTNSKDETNTRATNPLMAWLNNNTIGVLNTARLFPSINSVGRDFYNTIKSTVFGINSDMTKQAIQQTLQDISGILPVFALALPQSTFPKSPESIIGQSINNALGIKYINDIFRIFNSQTEKVASKEGLDALIENAGGVDVVNFFNGGTSKDRTYTVTDPETGKTMEVSKKTDLTSKLFSVLPGFDKNINVNYLQDGINRATDKKVEELTKINDKLSDTSGYDKDEIEKLVNDKQKLLRQVADNNLKLPDNVDKSVPNQEKLNETAKSSGRDNSQNSSKAEIVNKSARDIGTPGASNYTGGFSKPGRSRGSSGIKRTKKLSTSKLSGRTKFRRVKAKKIISRRRLKLRSS